jgi:hypothetical protein
MLLLNLYLIFYLQICCSSEVTILNAALNECDNDTESHDVNIICVLKGTRSPRLVKDALSATGKTRAFWTSSTCGVNSEFKIVRLRICFVVFKCFKGGCYLVSVVWHVFPLHIDYLRP